jgi:hypothetical protein
MYDTVPPAATVTSTATSPTKTSPIPFKVVFSKAVNGFTAAGVSAANGTVSNFVAVDSETFTFDVTPAGSGAVTATVNANAAFDAAGNGNATAAASVTFDTNGPGITIVPLVTNSTTPTINGTVDDPNATVVVSVGGQTINATVDSGGNWAAKVATPLAPNSYDVTVTATDKLGNTSTKTQTNGLVIDTTAPVPTVSSTAPEPTNKSPIPFTVTFDKDVTGFTAAEVTASNGTVLNFTPVNGKTYNFNVQASGPGAVMVSVAAGKATDAAGNTNVASNTLTRTLDTTAPALTINAQATSDTTPTITGTVDDPNASVSVTVAGSTLKANVSGNNWSATVLQPLGDGTYDVTATATDQAGNANTVQKAAGLVIDTTAPTVTLTTTSPNPTNAASISVKIEFSEPVTGFDASDISVVGGGASNLLPSNPQTPTQTFTADITPSADGTVVVSIPANVAQDQVGLGNTASATPITIVFDRSSPTPLITSTEPNPTAAGSIPITVDFGEPVTGFTQSDVVPANGNVTNFAGSGATYTFLVAPIQDGVVTLTIGSGVAQDAAGNANIQGTFTITSDRTNPVATVSSSAAPATHDSPIPFAVTFSKSVTGFDLSDLSVNNGTAKNLSGTGANYSFVVTPSGEGDVSVSVKAGAVDDGQGHTNPASSPLIVTFDTTAPTVAVTASANSPTNLALIPFTVVFSEPVTGFSTAGMTVDNGAVSNFAGSGNTYTFLVAPTVDGPVKVTVNAGAAQDAAGNTSTASATTSITSDRTVPTATITSTEPSPTAAATIPITVKFSAPVTGFGLASVTVVNGSATNLSGSGDTYTFDVTPHTDGEVRVTVAAGAARDAAGNLNTEATFSITSEIPPAVTGATVNPTATPDGSYGIGTVIDVQVTFSEAVTVATAGGTPTLTLNSGGTATYLSGSGTATLTFRYTVAAGQTAAALDYASATALSLNGGTIKDAAGNDATLTLPAPGGAGSISGSRHIVIDTTAPTLSSVTANPSSGTLGVGGSTVLTVSFSEPVTLSAGGTLTVALDTGATVTLTQDPSNPTVFTGTYTVKAGENSTHLNSTSLTLSGGTLKDAAGNDADLTISSTATLSANADIVVNTGP